MNRIVSSVLTSAGVLGGAMLGVEIANDHFRSRRSQDIGMIVGGLIGGIIVGVATEPRTAQTGVSGELAGFHNPEFP